MLIRLLAVSRKRNPMPNLGIRHDLGCDFRDPACPRMILNRLANHGPDEIGDVLYPFFRIGRPLDVNLLDLFMDDQDVAGRNSNDVLRRVSDVEAVRMVEPQAAHHDQCRVDLLRSPGDFELSTQRSIFP